MSEYFMIIYNKLTEEFEGKKHTFDSYFDHMN